MASLEYCQSIIDRGGGIITMPQWTMIVVGPPEAERNVSAGSMFVPIDGLTVERLCALVEEYRNAGGKKDWPKRDDSVQWDLPTKVLGPNGEVLWKRGDKSAPPKPGNLHWLAKLIK